MKKKPTDERNDELRPEYDMRQLLKGGVRGKHAAGYQEGTNLVLLAPDVAEVFANDAGAINEALRLVIQMSKLRMGKKGRLGKA
jgi:hypothetical protein